MKRSTPASERNREPIAEVLRAELPDRGLVLEVASGTGAHAAFFAERFPRLTWQPSEREADSFESIQAWACGSSAGNLLAPVILDVTEPRWPVEHADALLAINLLHISSYPAVPEGLFAGAARLLPPGAPLLVYGPFVRDGIITAVSNLAFDERLRSMNPAWGLRRAEDLQVLARARGIDLARTVDMPANNVALVFRRR